MYINATGFYVPEERVPNQHFFELKKALKSRKAIKYFFQNGFNF